MTPSYKLRNIVGRKTLSALRFGLSLRRARAVKNVLMENGVQEVWVGTEGHSFSKPLVPENNEEAWQKNRRVEFHFETIKDQKLFSDFFTRLNKKYAK